MNRLLFAVRGAYGLALVLAPSRAMSTVVGAPIDQRALVAARVLGVRELVQAELVRRHPSRATQLSGAGVDALHAASMFALAAADRGRRRLAMHNGATATVLALVSFAAAVV